MNVDAIQAVNTAKNGLLDRLQTLEPDDWAEAVQPFLRTLRRTELVDPAVSLAVVLDLAEQISKLAGGRSLRTPAQLASHIARRDYVQRSDNSQVLEGLEEDVYRWLAEVRAGTVTARMADFIDQHLDEPITLEDLAEVFGYSRRRVSAVFKQDISLTVRHYRMRQRIRRAQVLVRLCEKGEVAMLRVGCRNKTHFYKTFSRYTGRNPGEYSRTTQLDVA